MTEVGRAMGTHWELTIPLSSVDCWGQGNQACCTTRDHVEGRARGTASLFETQYLEEAGSILGGLAIP